MAAVIGSLRVVLGANTAAFEDGMKRASSAMKSWSKDASAVTAGLQLEKAIEGITRALVSSVTQAINMGEELNKLSKTTGVSVEELSALRFAANQSEATIEDVAKAFQVLSRNMAEASVNGTSQFARALKAMGLELKETDGSLKSQSKLFSEIATKFKQYEDGAEKAALAQALFKKFGVAIIPFLNEGGEGIDKLTKRARELGAVMGTDLARASDEFKDILGELRAVSEAFSIVVAKEMLPGLQRSTEALLAFASGGDRARAAGESIGSMLTTVVMNFSKLILLLEGIGTQWEKFRTLVQTPIFKDDNPLSGFSDAFKTARDDFNKTNADIKLALDKITTSFGPMQTEVANSVVRLHALSTALNTTGDVATTMAQKTLAPIVSMKEMKNAVEEFLKSQQKSIAGHKAEADAVFLGTGAKEALKVQYQAEAIALEKGIKLTDAMRLKIAGVGAEAGMAALRLEGMNLLFDNLDPVTKMNMELEKTRLAFKAISITEGPELERALDKVREKFGETWGAIGKNLADFAGSMSTLTKTLGKENKEMIILSKVFGIAQAIINTQIAVTKALAELGPVAGPIAAAAAIAAGAAAVATIAAQGFAQGGSFKVPGTGGGTDSMPVGFMATPGERVTVETPQQQRGGGETVIQLRGKSFGFDDIRDVFDQINAGMRDGHRFLVARA